MRFLKLRHIDGDHIAFAAVEYVGKRNSCLRLSHAAWPDEKKHSHRLDRIVQIRPRSKNPLSNRGECMILANHALLQVFVKCKHCLDLIAYHLAQMEFPSMLKSLRPQSARRPRRASFRAHLAAFQAQPQLACSSTCISLSFPRRLRPSFSADSRLSCRLRIFSIRRFSFSHCSLSIASSSFAASICVSISQASLRGPRRSSSRARELASAPQAQSS